MPIEAVAMYNTTADRLMFHPKGRDNGYVLTMGGKRIYLAGDTEETPELKNLAEHRRRLHADEPALYADGGSGRAWVKDFKPKIVYPYHYGMMRRERSSRPRSAMPAKCACASGIEPSELLKRASSEAAAFIAKGGRFLSNSS